jgi:hypothetical protein
MTTKDNKQNTSTEQANEVSTSSNWLKSGFPGGFKMVMASSILFVVLFFFSRFGISYLAPQTERHQRFAVVDLAGVVAIKEREFTELISGKAVTDADRGRAFDLVQKLGVDVEAALSQIKKECDCSLLVANAVVSANSNQLIDYTPQLKKLLGIDAGNANNGSGVKR